MLSKSSLSNGKQEAWKTLTRILALLLGVGPLLVLLVFVVSNALKEHPLCGPEPDAWFRTVGWSICYGAPLVLFACTLIGYAIREKSSAYAFAAGLLFNLVTTAVYLLEISKAGRALDGVTWIEVAQVNSIVSAIIALFWTAAITWHEKRTHNTKQQKSDKNDWPLLIVSQVLIASMMCGLPLAAGVTSLAMHPIPASWAAAVGGPLGWLAFILSIATAATLLWRSHLKINEHHIGWMLIAASSMIALTATRSDTGDWLGYHTLLVCIGATAWVMSFLPRLGIADEATFDTKQTSTGWSKILLFVTFALGLRAVAHDPSAPWWTLAAWLAMMALSFWLSWLTKRRSYIWVAGILANMSVGLWWIESGSILTISRGFAQLIDFVLVNIIVTATISMVSVLLERMRFFTMHEIPKEATHKSNRQQSSGLIGFHRVATWGCILSLGTVAGLYLLSDFYGRSSNVNWAFYGGALAATILAVIACFWDAKTRYPVASFYCTGIVANSMFLDSLNAKGHLFAWCETLLLASFALATSYLWSQRDKLRNLATQLGAPLAPEHKNQPHSRDGQTWLVAANYSLSLLLVALVFWIELTFPAYAQRIVAAYALLAAAMSLALLAKGTGPFGITI